MCEKIGSLTCRTIRIENIRLGAYVRDRENGAPTRKRQLRDLLHTHSYYELFAVVGSPVNLFFSEHEEPLSAGEILVVPPDFPHTRHILSETEGSCFAIGISVERLEGEYELDLWKKYRRMFDPRLPVRFRGCRDIIEQLRSASDMLDKDNYTEPMLRIATLINALCARPVSTVSLPAILDSGKMKRMDLQRIIALENIISLGYTGELSAEDVAGALHISRRHLDRIVKERYGKPLSALITERRLVLAEELLRTTKLSARRIAEETGFGDGDTLTRNFKRLRGCTPSDIRRVSK